MIITITTFFVSYREELCEFLPYMSPHSVVRRSSDGRVTHLVMARTGQDDDGNWIVDEEETLKKKCVNE